MASLTTTITELPESRVRVQAQVPAEEVEHQLQQTARKLGSQLRVPGFRKGKVPPAVVIRRLGRDYVLDEALRAALGSWYVDAIDTSGIVPIGEPDLDVGDLPAQGEPLQFSIEIGVRPSAQLGEYKGLEVGRREPEVEDAKIDEALEGLRERMATLDTVERPAQKGDHIVADYIGKLDGEPFEGGTARDQLIELGAGALIPGFEEQLEGISAGEERTITVTFPEQYAEELAGREATFDVTAHEVKAKNLPELDDDFASEASEFDTLAELREDIAAKLREAEDSAIEREFEQAVLQAAADNATVEVPAALVHARAHEMVEQSFTALARQGISREMYLQIAGKSEHELAEEAEPEAAQALRREAVLAAIAEAEQVDPSDEDLIEALRPAAERDGSDPAEVVETLRRSGRMDQLRDDVAARQALERLVASATPISVSAAEAREALWTPDKGEPADAGSARPGGAEGSGAGSGKLWTPGG
jgi:trigger factor